MKLNQGTLVLIGLVVVGFLFMNGGFGGTTDAPDTTTPSQCDASNANLEISTFDAEFVGTAVGGSHRIYEPRLGGIADATDLTVPTLSSYSVLLANASSTYYAKPANFEVGCVDKDAEAELANVGTLTTTTVNSDGITKNSASAEEAVGADDVVELEFEYDVDSNNYWGNPDVSGSKNIIVFGYNSTITDIEVEGASAAPVPQGFSLTGGRTEEQAYYIPSVADGGENTLTIIIDSGSDVPGANDIQVSLYDVNIDLNEDDLSLIEDVEDEDNNLLSIAVSTDTIYLS